jgi:hypothetical protein
MIIKELPSGLIIPNPYRKEIIKSLIINGTEGTPIKAQA